LHLLNNETVKNQKDQNNNFNLFMNSANGNSYDSSLMPHKYTKNHNGKEECPSVDSCSLQNFLMLPNKAKYLMDDMNLCNKTLAFSSQTDFNNNSSKMLPEPLRYLINSDLSYKCSEMNLLNSIRQIKIDMDTNEACHVIFGMVEKLCFLMVDWARQSLYFKDIKVSEALMLTFIAQCYY
jgi:hypothetical protein